MNKLWRMVVNKKESSVRATEKMETSKQGQKFNYMSMLLIEDGKCGTEI